MLLDNVFAHNRGIGNNNFSIKPRVWLFELVVMDEIHDAVQELNAAIVAGNFVYHNEEVFDAAGDFPHLGRNRAPGFVSSSFKNSLQVSQGVPGVLDFL